MSNIEKVNLSGTNQIRFMAQPKNSSESKESSVKKYFTAPNVILGSLATIGVLGMADVLICKGKHLNKITGKGKELEEALSRATTAETKLKGTEAKLEEILASSGKDAEEIKALKEKLAQLETKIRPGGIEETLLKKFQSLYIECEDFGPEATKYIRTELDKTLKMHGCKFVEPTSLKYKSFSDPEFSRLYSYERAAISDIDVTAHAIVDRNNNVVLKGHCFVPETI